MVAAAPETPRIALIRLRDVHLAFAERVLFDGLEWHVLPGHRIGLVGDNGVGKTTLLKLMTGQLEADGGVVRVSKGVELGYLAQDFSFSADRPVLEVVLDGAEGLRRLEQDIAEEEQRLATLAVDEPEFDACLARISRMRERFEQAGGFRLESHARRILAGLGFSTEQAEQPLDSFSGGWQMRVALAGLLLRRPDLLLLDEPTNHLDVDTIEWLERFLKTYSGTVIVVSHDRFFLDRIARQITHLTARGLRHYTGNYTEYLRQLEEETERLKAQAAREGREEARVRRFVERFRYKNTKSKQVQSRLKMLEKRDRVEIDEEEGTIAFRFPPCRRAGELVLELQGVGQRYGELQVFEGLDLSIPRGERVALVGPNGAGKSTLMRLVAGIEEPATGARKLGHNVDVATYTQEFERSLDEHATVIEELGADVSDFTVTELRSLAGAFRFSGDDAEKPVGVLSGGEKSRLAVAKLLLTSANLLVLDEPTNHLDLKAKDVLQKALLAFEGTLLIVSHDRFFLDGVVDRVLEMRAGRMRDFRGDYSHYLWMREREGGPEEGAETPKGGAARSDKQQKKAASAERIRVRRELRAHQRRVEEAEAELVAIEARMVELEEVMASSELYEEPAKLEATTREHAELRKRLEATMAEWEAGQERLDAARAAAEDSA